MITLQIPAMLYHSEEYYYRSDHYKNKKYQAHSQGQPHIGKAVRAILSSG